MRFASQLTALLFVMSLSVASLCGCATATKISVSSIHDQDAVFTDLETYDWMPEPRERTDDPRIEDEALNTRIRTTVEAQLTVNGFRKRTSGEPDFYIGYHAALDDRLDIEDINAYYNYAAAPGMSTGLHTAVAGGWVYAGSNTKVREYAIGTLVLDIVEPGTRNLLWRGTAQAEIEKKDSADKREQRLKTAVRMMLSGFPPQ
jgi:hypothetical protein